MGLELVGRAAAAFLACYYAFAPSTIKDGAAPLLFCCYKFLGGVLFGDEGVLDLTGFSEGLE